MAELLPLEDIVSGVLITQKLIFGILLCKSVRQLIGFMNLYRRCNFVLTNLSLKVKAHFLVNVLRQIKGMCVESTYRVFKLELESELYPMLR